MRQPASTPACKTCSWPPAALGLGATLTTWHHLLEPEFKAALDIPRTVHTCAIVLIGWPIGTLGPVTRHPVTNVIHHDTW